MKQPQGVSLIDFFLSSEILQELKKLSTQRTVKQKWSVGKALRIMLDGLAFVLMTPSRNYTLCLCAVAFFVLLSFTDLCTIKSLRGFFQLKRKMFKHKMLPLQTENGSIKTDILRNKKSFKGCV